MEREELNFKGALEEVGSFLLHSWSRRKRACLKISPFILVPYAQGLEVGMPPLSQFESNLADVSRFRMWRSSLWHESQHVRYPIIAPPQFMRGNVKHEILNILEDFRADSLGLREWKGMQNERRLELLTALYQFSPLRERSLNETEKVLVKFSFALLGRLYGIGVEVPEKAQKAVDFVLSRTEDLKSPGWSANLVSGVLKLLGLEEEKEKHVNQQALEQAIRPDYNKFFPISSESLGGGSESGEEGEGKRKGGKREKKESEEEREGAEKKREAGEEGEGEAEEKEEKEGKEEKGRAEGKREAGKRAKGKEGAEAGGEGAGGEAHPLTMEEIAEEINRMVREIPSEILESYSLVKKIAREMVGMSPEQGINYLDLTLVNKYRSVINTIRKKYFESPAKSGEFDTETYLSSGRKFGFLHETPNRVGGFKVILLLDMSGSIRDVAKGYYQHTASLGKALELAGIRFSVYVLQNSHVWKVKSSTSRFIPGKITLPPGGGTPWDQMLAEARRDPLFGQNCLIVSVTDGMPDSENRVVEQNREIHRAGAISVALTLNNAFGQEKGREQGYWLTIPANLGELESKFFQVLLEVSK